MAYGFGASGGTGSSDKIQSAFGSDHSNTFSWFVWALRRGDGSNPTSTRIWANTDGSRAPTFMGDSSGGNLRVSLAWDGTSPQWEWTRPANDAWFSTGIRYDWGSAANNAVVFSNGSKLEVGSGLTETFSPSGAEVPGTDGFFVGNGAGVIREWNGYIAEFAVWNVLLDDAEFFKLAAGYSPLFVRPQSLLEYLPLVRTLSSRKVGPAGVAAGTPLVQPHPRIIMPHAKPLIRIAPEVVVPYLARHELSVVRQSRMVAY